MSPANNTLDHNFFVIFVHAENRVDWVYGLRKNHVR
jgi:hypothetical protein